MMFRLLFFLFCILLYAQPADKVKSHIVNPKHNWYFGAEIGRNQIKSNDFKNNTFINFGVTAEYYFHKYWSVQSKMQFYKTEVAYSGNQTFLSNGNKPYQTLFFEGSIISVPVVIKYDFKIHKNFRGFIHFGPAYNIETSSNYTVPQVSNPDLSGFPSTYFSYNVGWGLSYAVSDKMAFYFVSFANEGGFKGGYNNFLSSGNRVAMNELLNFGIKYNFKIKKP